MNEDQLRPFRVRTFNNAEKFLALALERFVKLELVDVWIRSTNGIEFLQEPHEESPGTGISI